MTQNQNRNLIETILLQHWLLSSLMLRLDLLVLAVLVLQWPCQSPPSDMKVFRKEAWSFLFEPGVFSDYPGGRRGLRSLTNDQLDEILKLAECTIISSLSNENLDSYVLSESILFVYPYKAVIKTCRATKLLLSVPLVFKLVESRSFSVPSMTYTRGNFIFAEALGHFHTIASPRKYHSLLQCLLSILHPKMVSVMQVFWGYDLWFRGRQSNFL